MNWPLMGQALARWTPWTDFAQLTPLHLSLTAGLLLWYAPGRSAPGRQANFQVGFWGFVGLSAVTGWAVEWLGVRTGLIFGTYQYGQTLGWKVDGIPLTMALNWLILVMAASELAHWSLRGSKLGHPWWMAGLAASLMTGLDFWLEPVAMHLDFWQWAEGLIPVQNFVAWWLVSFPLCAVYLRLPFAKDYALARFVYLAQLLFFAGHYVMMLL